MYTDIDIAISGLLFLIGLVCLPIGFYLRHVRLHDLAMLLMAAVACSFPVISIRNLVSAILDPAIVYERIIGRQHVEFSLASDPVVFWLHAAITMGVSGYVVGMALYVRKLARDAPNNSFKPKPLRSSTSFRR